MGTQEQYFFARYPSTNLKPVSLVGQVGFRLHERSPINTGSDFSYSIPLFQRWELTKTYDSSQLISGNT